MMRRACLALSVCLLVSVVSVAASPAGAQQDAEANTRQLAVDFHDVNVAVVHATFNALLDRDATTNEVARFADQLDRGLTERQLQAHLFGTREFWLANATSLRSYANAVYQKTEGRRASRIEWVAMRRAYNRTEGNRRDRRRAAAAVALADSNFDADGFAVNLLNVHRAPTGFITSINVRLNKRTSAEASSVNITVDGSPVAGTVEYRNNGKQLRLVPERPLLATGKVTARITNNDLRADADTFLNALRGSLFPHVRVVAYYGNHQTPVLGVLGESGPEGAADRVRAAANRFSEPGRPAVGAFEMIVTVAQASAGADGNYSHPSNIQDVKRWVDVARDEGMYVILDIQPGQSDFYRESIRYRELLLEPHVGLALDPEWRMLPGQRPGQLVGSVDAAEINRVSEWLSDLVVENNLPDKMFILHQFQTRMIRNRETLIDRPGLATIIHADGFGGRSIKLQTYGILKVDPPFFNGFKLFIDEDTRIFQPADVLDFTTVPVPDLITYQ